MESEDIKSQDSEQIELPGFPPETFFQRLFRKIEDKCSVLSLNNVFWYRFLSFIYFPIGFKSGIKLGKNVDGVYETVLPFKRSNKNWYGDMAGAAILANTEIAGGMAVFQYVGEKYTIVCKDLSFKFRLPCKSKATYRVKIIDDIKQFMISKPEFNVKVEIEVLAELKNKIRKIGTSNVTFHVAAKGLMAQRLYKAKQRAKA